MASKEIANFNSESGDDYWIPEGQYHKDVERYKQAVADGEEDVMLNFEEGMTGWVLCDGRPTWDHS